MNHSCTHKKEKKRVKNTYVALRIVEVPKKGGGGGQKTDKYGDTNSSEGNEIGSQQQQKGRGGIWISLIAPEGCIR